MEPVRGSVWGEMGIGVAEAKTYSCRVGMWCLRRKKAGKGGSEVGGRDRGRVIEGNEVAGARDGKKRGGVGRGVARESLFAGEGGGRGGSGAWRICDVFGRGR